MKKVCVFQEDELNQLKFDIIEAIVKESKKDYGVKFIGRDGGEEMEGMAIRGHLIFCIDRVWPK